MIVFLELGQNWQQFMLAFLYYNSIRKYFWVLVPDESVNHRLLTGVPKLQLVCNPSRASEYKIISEIDGVSIDFGSDDGGGDLSDPEIPYVDILVPSSTDHDSWVVRFEPESKDTIAMSMFISELSFEIVTGFLGLLVVDPDDVVATSSSEVAAIMGVV